MGRLKHRAFEAEEAKRRRTRLGDLTAHGADIFCRCNRCGHSAVLGLDMLLARFGPQQDVPGLGLFLRCRGCGSKDVATRPDWPCFDATGYHPTADVEVME
ncbi:hypothetical protein KAJ83_07280 [Marivibrio halodurans]|uniref:Uncharacterized protein n=1 Tax=Marivibrio halodurans TaxID=2039722 RepID=A0A8J7RYA6_9PROT|nr:hypothetical protein [Marivibrio halodurans]MBP5856805.1 hypothetical protein [Marivibrio halodurans]